MNRGRLTPTPQGRAIFGVTRIQLQALNAVATDQTSWGALVGCVGAPRTAIIVVNYQAAPWLPAVGA